MAASIRSLVMFGVDLNFLLRREQETDDMPPGTIPSVVERCLSEIEARGLTETGSTSTINALKEASNRGTDPITEDTDIHAVATLSSREKENLDDRLTSIRNVVQALPRPKFDLLKRVSEHLDRVADFEDRNQMAAEGFVIVSSRNLLRPPQENFAMILANTYGAHAQAGEGAYHPFPCHL
ncbi:Rho GTPase activation protein [Mycena vitilis]|nr:Rho GTPase activation protein [Mycena vitilis]